MEQMIHFLSGNLTIEGLLARGDGDKGVVITHPHSLYGGNMYNPVVEAISQAYQKKNYTTLKFNFRGVGKSEGEYDNGIGEQQDVIAALTYLYESGIQTIDLAGYSFGAWVNAKLCAQSAWNYPFALPALVMVSPPVGFLDFGDVKILPRLKLVISGSEDEIAPVELIKTQVQQWNSETRLKIISGADHFYSEDLGTLQSIMALHI